LIALGSSGALAVLLAEPDADAIADVPEGAGQLAIFAANALECAIGLLPGPDREDTAAVDRLVALSETAASLPVDVTRLKRANAARVAHEKGRHPALLRYGDCFAHALARAIEMRLLFIGDEFTRTDMRPVMP
jgi:ribonuclease VapC